MYVTHGTGQEIENARVALVLITLGITVFWRLVLRVLLAVAIVAAGTGALLLLHSMHPLPVEALPVGSPGPSAQTFDRQTCTQ